MPRPDLWGCNEAARVHYAGWGCGHVAFCGASPAKRNTDDWDFVAWRGAAGATTHGIILQALRQLGFVEGKNVALELRYAKGGLQQLPELAAELVRMKADVLLTFGDLTPKIAQQATKTIPIVAISDDIVGAGLVTSLSHPGGNTTGLTIMSPELSAKRLEVLKEIVPGISRVAALWDPTTGASQVALTEHAASSMGLNLQVLEVRRRDDVVAAFRAAGTITLMPLTCLTRHP